MIEFTGERVVPGQVNDDLWAEHLARYAFAARFANSRRILDIGCGTGYGTAHLARFAKSATGLDLAHAAVTYAREHHPECQYLQASATQLPFPTAAFELITAFEVIEHLDDWDSLIAEAKRVLAPGGMFLVSTPNKLYYSESRAEHGPNPYHHHEFEYAEFYDALTGHFPHTAILLQDRLETFAFYSPETVAADAQITKIKNAPEEANFFLGVCSADSLPDLRALLWVPEASNLLRERERHIHLLQDELDKNKQWLLDLSRDRDALLREHATLQQHLDHQNKWALDLEQKWSEARERITQLEEELEVFRRASQERIAELDASNREKTDWAVATEQLLQAEMAKLARALALLDEAETTVVQRTEWAQGLEARLHEFQILLLTIADSRWIKLGRKLGLGPVIQKGSE